MAFVDAVGLAEQVRRGEVSSQELVEAAIGRIQKSGEINAVISPTFEEARAAAPAAPDGPFRGVPFLLKDLGVEQRGLPYYMGTRLLRDLGYRSPADSPLGARFRQAGLVTLGKTNAPELGPQPTTQPLAFGPTRNPWALDRTPGGSSGGSCAAVAAGLLPAAHANDGGGSIRIPAGWCGLVGLKPSRGRLPGGPAHISKLTNDGVVTRTVRDTAALLDAVSGPVTGALYTAPPLPGPLAAEVGADPGRLRIGVVTEPSGFDVDPECRAAVERTARLLESIGHTVEAGFPAALIDGERGPATAALWSVGTAQRVQALAQMAGRDVGPDDFEPYTWAQVERARDIKGIDYLAALEWEQGWATRFASWWDEGWDLLLMPTAPEPPPLLTDLAVDPEHPGRAGVRFGRIAFFTMPANVTGLPAISLPLGQTAAGLPVGVQLMAALGREDLLVRVASQLETAAPWVDRTPANWWGEGAPGL